MIPILSSVFLTAARRYDPEGLSRGIDPVDARRIDRTDRPRFRARP